MRLHRGEHQPGRPRLLDPPGDRAQRRLPARARDDDRRDAHVPIRPGNQVFPVIFMNNIILYIENMRTLTFLRNAYTVRMLLSKRL